MTLTGVFYLEGHLFVCNAVYEGTTRIKDEASEFKTVGQQTTGRLDSDGKNLI